MEMKDPAGVVVDVPEAGVAAMTALGWVPLEPPAPRTRARSRAKTKAKPKPKAGEGKED